MADLNLREAGSGKVEVGAGAETNHADSLAGSDGVARFAPAHDTAGDEPGDLSDENRPAGGAEKPGLIFVAKINLEVAGIKEFTRGVVDFFNCAGKRTAIDVDIKNGKKNSHAAKLTEAKTGVGGLVDADDFTIGGAEKGEGVAGGSAGGITKKEKKAKEKKKGEDGTRNPADPEGETEKGGSSEEEGSCFA